MIDQTLFLKINNLAGQSVWLDRVGVFFTDYAGYILILVLIGFWFLRRNPKNKAMVAIALLSGIVARGLFTTVIRFFYHHPRPFTVLTVRQLIPESGFSFPSGHAAFFFALSTAVYFYNRKLGAIFFVVSALMGLARVYAGVHWPIDIAGGVVLGVLTAFLTRFALAKFYPDFKSPH